MYGLKTNVANKLIEPGIILPGNHQLNLGRSQRSQKWTTGCRGRFETKVVIVDDAASTCCECVSLRLTRARKFLRWFDLKIILAI